MSAAAPSPPFECERLSVRFGDRTALAEVDLRVAPGEVVALAGPNGSGKTTLIRAGLGLLAPSGGTARLFGAPVAGLSVRERARRVAWVPQEESPRDDVPVLRFVLYGRHPHLGPFDRESDDDRRVALATLSGVGLADRAEDGIFSVSGGERQRLVLARALTQATTLLFLDEPTAHLDIGHQLDVLTRVRALARARGIAVLAAIHDLNLAARFADRIVVLHRGRVVADGPPRSVLSGELLRSVWGVAADLRSDARTGLPYLLPRLPELPSGARSPADVRFGPVHVVGGGGAAAETLHRLVDSGYLVTAGVLHLLDTDAEAAEALALPAVLEAPFAPIGLETRRRHRELLDAARAIVVTPFAVGPSNLANLEDLPAPTDERPVYLLEPLGSPRLDFADGRGARERERLRLAGAVPVPDLEALLDRLSERPRTPRSVT